MTTEAKLGSALNKGAAPKPPERCTAGGKPINPATGECACCSD